MKVAEQIIEAISNWEQYLSALPDGVIHDKRNEQGRSIKQTLGHLVDSASNNIHRIVHLQYQECPLTFPNYASFGNNDRWIAIQSYQDEEWTTLVQLWKYLNLHLAHVISNVNSDKLSNEWIAGADTRITLGEMIEDYPIHMLWHLDEIRGLVEQ